MVSVVLVQEDDVNQCRGDLGGVGVMSSLRDLKPYRQGMHATLTLKWWLIGGMLPLI